MKDIKIEEVRQALDYIFCQLESSEVNCEVQKERNKIERCLKCNIPKSRNVLDQFITDTENLIKENEELRKQAIEMRDNFQETIRERNYNGERFNTLHDSQMLEPSVLEKIDKLEKENEQYKNSNKQVYEELKKTIKQLAICDKALDKACDMLVANDCDIMSEDLIVYTKEQWKNYLLKESENTNENIKN